MLLPFWICTVFCRILQNVLAYGRTKKFLFQFSSSLREELKDSPGSGWVGDFGEMVCYFEAVELQAICIIFKETTKASLRACIKYALCEILLFSAMNLRSINFIE